MEELAPHMRGWRSYFGFCGTPEGLIHLTRWVRLRLRAALIDLGVLPRLAAVAALAWYLARAKALSVGFLMTYCKSLGMPSLFEAC